MQPDPLREAALAATPGTDAGRRLLSDIDFAWFEGSPLDPSRSLDSILAIEAAAAREALDLLETFIERTPCRFDHHGGCQEHGFLEPEDPWSPCPMAEGRRLLGWEEPTPTYDRRAARASDGGR